MEDRISELEHKIDIKEKTEELLEKDSKTVKEMQKNSADPSKDQTCESWALKKEKRGNPRGYVIFQQNNSRKFPKS
jgi:hypothetical protein